jgi:hypothetical protein
VRASPKKYVPPTSATCRATRVDAETTRKPVAYGTPAQRSKQAEPRRQLLVVDLTGTIRHAELQLSLCRLDCRGEVSMS